jgi:DNA repair protein RecN (Recombination protein N)
MLARLHVRNYVLIDSLEIDFPEGLIIITGQTGAGKSILLGALSLVTGAKADAAMVSEGADNCVVEAEFDTDDASIKDILEENEVEWDEGHLIIRRVVNRSGRSRAFVNDSPVPVTVLQDISSRLIDIHSQHQTLLLSDRQFQLDILDHYAGNMNLRQECASAWKALTSMKSELAALEARIARIASDKEYNEAQFRQLENASLREGELAELEEEQKQLANAEDIKTGLCGVEELLSIDSSLKESVKMLTKVGRYISSVSELAERLDSCRVELDDILAEVTDINSRVEMSEERLEQVESRMSMIYGLMKKHACADEAELIALRDRLSEELFDSTRLEEQAEDMRIEISKAEASFGSIAKALHAARAKAALTFAEEIASSIRGLEMPYAVFEVDLSECAVSAYGADAVSFRFSASGRNPVDVAKCASGGEMSRIMLALKAMMARFTSMPTMIFDEIDTGVSGSVADKMGSMICQMGENMQVFAITHLPQVAAKGNAHYVVTKTIDPTTSKAVSGISRLTDQERVMEVARMLSGSVLTDAAIANAKELLKC